MLKLGIELDTFAVLLEVELELVSFVLEVEVASGVFAVLP